MMPLCESVSAAVLRLHLHQPTYQYHQNALVKECMQLLLAATANTRNKATDQAGCPTFYASEIEIL